MFSLVYTLQPLFPSVIIYSAKFSLAQISKNNVVTCVVIYDDDDDDDLSNSISLARWNLATTGLNSAIKSECVILTMMKQT